LTDERNKHSMLS